MKRPPLYGAENMPKDRPTVIIANHQQNDDLFVMGDLLPPRGGVAVGKSSLVWVPFFGQVFWLGGNIILNRGRAAKAVATMQATSDAINRERKSIWVFPEGTRSRGRGWVASRKGGHFTWPLPLAHPSPWCVRANTMANPEAGPDDGSLCLCGFSRQSKHRA